MVPLRSRVRLSLGLVRNRKKIIGSGVDAAERVVIFQFDGPPSTYAFWFRMGRDRNGALHCTMTPDRLNTVVRTLTEAGRRTLSQSD